MGVIREEKFSVGAFEDGSLTAWLKRLKEIDWKRKSRNVKELSFNKGGVFGGYTAYQFTFNDDGAKLMETDAYKYCKPYRIQKYSSQDAALLKERFSEIHIEYWNTDYFDPYICDGEQWNLSVLYSDGYTLEHYGSNAYPRNWKALLEFFGIGSNDDERMV
jgi:hypothetical protein